MIKQAYQYILMIWKVTGLLGTRVSLRPADIRIERVGSFKSQDPG